MIFSATFAGVWHLQEPSGNPNNELIDHRLLMGGAAFLCRDGVVALRCVTVTHSQLVSRGAVLLDVLSGFGACLEWSVWLSGRPLSRQAPKPDYGHSALPTFD